MICYDRLNAQNTVEERNPDSIGKGVFFHKRDVILRL